MNKDIHPDVAKERDLNGMDLRDFFAATASEGDVKWYQKKIARELDNSPEFSNDHNPDHIPREIAKYRYADEMMEARK